MKTEHVPQRGRGHKHLWLTCLSLLSLSLVVGSPAVWAAPFAYIGNFNASDVSVIDTADNTIVATIPVGNNPVGVAVSLDGSRVYVANQGSNTVSAIETSTNMVIATISVGSFPFGIAVHPDGSKVYIANQGSDDVSVIDLASHTVVAAIPVGFVPTGVAFLPDGSLAYVSNQGDGDIAVIDTASNTVTAIIPVTGFPFGVAVHPTGSEVYVANFNNFVSVIDPTINTITATVNVSGNPVGITVHPDGSTVYTAGSAGTLQVIDVATRTVSASISIGGTGIGVDVHPNGSALYVTCLSQQHVIVVDTTTFTVQETIMIGSGSFTFGEFIGPLPVTEITVGLDIRPFSVDNPINLTSQGKISIAIFGSAEVNVEDIDVPSVTVAGAPIVQKNNGNFMAVIVDLDDDGLLDLSFHVHTQDLSLVVGDTEACVAGMLTDGTPIVGCDGVTIVPANS